jgi:hypothetical protein
MATVRYAKIAINHNVARRCNYQVIDRDSATNEIKGLFPLAMKLRVDRNEKYLSTNWLENFGGTRDQRLKAVVAVHRAKAKSRLSLESGIAIINSGRIAEIGNTHRRSLTVRHTPAKGDPSYARISGLPLDNSDESLIASLADEAYRDLMLLKEVDALP